MEKMSIPELLKLNLSDGSIPNTIVTTTTYDEAVEPSLHIKEVVTVLNTQYLLEGSYNFEDLKQRVPILLEMGSEQLEELFTEVNKILEDARGLPPFQINFKTTKILDPRFVAACNIIMDVSDKRSVAAKLKDVSLSTKQWNNFLRTKANREYYDKLIENLMDYDTWQESRLAIARNVSAGDLSSIKYFHELTGKFVAQKDFDPRILTYMMTAILEIVVKHVDGHTARIIADELEAVAVKELTL